MQRESKNTLIGILTDIQKKLEVIAAASRDWLTPEQLASYIGLSVSTIYQYVSNRKIPFHKIPGSSKLLFQRNEIDAWIQGDVDVKDDQIHAEKVVDEIWEKI